MKILAESTLSSKEEIVVPKAVQQLLHLDVGDRVIWSLNAQGELVVSAGHPYTLADIRAAVAAAGGTRPPKGITVEKMERGIAAYIREKHVRD
jgi:hypothetical protein